MKLLNVLTIQELDIMQIQSTFINRICTKLHFLKLIFTYFKTISKPRKLLI